MNARQISVLLLLRVCDTIICKQCISIPYSNMYGQCEYFLRTIDFIGALKYNNGMIKTSARLFAMRTMRKLFF